MGLRKLLLSTPKTRGFKSLYSKMTVVNIADLDKEFKDGERVTPQTLLEKGLVGKMNIEVKILGDGELKKKLSVKGCAVSASAKEKIEKAGGTIKE